MAQVAKSRTPAKLLTRLHLSLERVEAGVPVDTMTSFVSASGVELKDIYDVVIPARTLKHRRSRRDSRSPDEYDHSARPGRLGVNAVGVFGGGERARHRRSAPK
jgi:uncharacterized protein (DUF2384 family)